MDAIDVICVLLGVFFISGAVSVWVNALFQPRRAACHSCGFPAGPQYYRDGQGRYWCANCYSSLFPPF